MSSPDRAAKSNPLLEGEGEDERGETPHPSSSKSFDGDGDGDGDSDGFLGWDHGQRRRVGSSSNIDDIGDYSGDNDNDKDDAKVNFDEERDYHCDQSQTDYNCNYQDDTIDADIGNNAMTLPTNDNSVNEYRNHSDDDNHNNNNDYAATTAVAAFPPNNNYNHDNNNYQESFASSNSSTTSSTENDKWSLSVRLNSAVDLPSSIIPSTPLCPLMKFGLITVTAEDEVQDLEKSSAKFRRAEFEMEPEDVGMNGNVNSNVNLNQVNSQGVEGDLEQMKIDGVDGVGLGAGADGNNNNNNGGALLTSSKVQNSLKMVSFSGKEGILAHFQKTAPLEECVASSSALSSSPHSATKVQHTSGKIMSKRDSGMVEWHEDMRWDDVEAPLQTVLCIELSARAVFPPSFLSAMDTLSNSGTTGNAYSNDSDRSNNNYNNNWSSPMSVTGQHQNHQNHRRNESAYSTNSINPRELSISTSVSPPPSGNNNGNNGGLLGFLRKGRGGRGRRAGGGNNSATPTNTHVTSNPPSYHGSDDDMTDENIKEMEKATAAATVARYLMEYNSKNELDDDDDDGGGGDSPRSRENHGNDEFANSPLHDGDIRLGTLLIPISNLPLEDEVPTVEKWYQFDSVTAGSKGDYNKDLSSSKVPSLRSPSVLLQISLSNPDTLDEIEEEAYLALSDERGGEDSSMSIINDDMRLSLENPHLFGGNGSVDFSTNRTRKETEESDVLMKEKMKLEEEERIAENGPYLKPGIVDHICVVGPESGFVVPKNDSRRGWLDNVPDSCVLEQFPPEGYHITNGRNSTLPNKVDWWCFPEGCKLWRGTEPPTHMDMNLKRFSASSPPTMASSIAAFDACLDCTSSFMWWVMSSNSDQYGSKAAKVYGAVIRFYVPAPSRDVATPMNGAEEEKDKAVSETNRLWCPIGICVTSSLPIVGVLEALLLRLCEKLSTNITPNNISDKTIHKDVMNLILNYQAPVPGMINCSIPFLAGDGDRLLISLTPQIGLPPLPHGAAVTSVCRLLGAEGLTALLGAVLTECKILIHSADVANLAMVGEVITALIYPFRYQLPFIPVIPLSLMEMIEAPVSYFIGVPSCNMKWVDKSVLADVVVIDLDNGFSTPDYFDGRRGAPSSRATTPLPATVSSNITKAVFRLLRDEEEIEEQFGASNFSDTRHLPRLDSESLAERNFRIAVAQQICSLIRGYQECLFFVSVNQPVFNRDRFLRQAPALFEERMGSVSRSPHSPTIEGPSQRILSPRSKRFLSGLVNTQHFHDLLERLDSEETGFFHQVMDSFQATTDADSTSSSANQAHLYNSQQQIDSAEELSKSLEEMEHNIPTYHVHRDGNKRSSNLQRYNSYEGDEAYYMDNDSYMSSFTSVILKKANIQSQSRSTTNKLSLQQMIELEKKPWEYCRIFDIKINASAEKDGNDTNVIWSKIQLREAMGERKFRAWKVQQEEKVFGSDEVLKGGQKNVDMSNKKSALDLTKLIPSLDDGVSSNNFITSKINIADERDVVRRYIENAYEIDRMNRENVDDKKKKKSLLAFNHFISNGTNTEVENALRKPSAQRFLVSVLSQRSRLQNERRQINNDINGDTSVSHLQPIVFDCLVHLCNAMLEACMKDYDFESAYRLLTNTTGFCSVQEDSGVEDYLYHGVTNVSFLTKRIGMHAIYADMRLWERVLLLHQQARQKDKTGGSDRYGNQSFENDQYEAAVSTLYEMLGYGMSADDLARFASRVAAEKFFSTDKEQKILMLARRLVLKCDEIDINRDSMLLRGRDISDEINSLTLAPMNESETKAQWEEINWTHSVNAATSLGLSPRLDIGGQSPVTALTSFGSSIVASGALDGSIFVAHTFNIENSGNWNPSLSSNKNVSGVRLEWQKNSNVTSPGGNLGAISCLASSKGSSHSVRPNAFDFDSVSDNEAIIEAVAGCRIIGGTTGGELRVWSVHDVLMNELAKHPEDANSMMSESLSSTQSSNVRARSLGTHRGGVTCLSVPSQIYRPDSLLSGGNDGLIKQWSLRQESSGQSRRMTMGGRTSRMLFSGRESTAKRQGQEAVNVLAGHGGRILCLETAWHADRLLSGAADLTMKLWDLASSGGQCIQTMHGHTGWVTSTCFWGRNTAISASTDRSIALWDMRSGSAPLFVLRHHQSPVSDVYIGSRNSFWMTSAGADGDIATWDFRKFSYLNRRNDSLKLNGAIATIREPLSVVQHYQSLRGGAKCVGPVMLAKGVSSKYGQGERSVMSVGSNGLINEWDVLSGRLLSEHNSKHTNKISCFKSFHENDNLSKGHRGTKSSSLCLLGGTITAAWDGKIKLRRMVLKKGQSK